MSSFARPTTLRALAGLTLALLLAASFVVGAGHDKHDSERCPICKLNQVPAFGVTELAYGVPPVAWEPTASPVVGLDMRRGAFRPFAPRGPPA